jgi:hypothetical protein
MVFLALPRTIFPSIAVKLLSTGLAFLHNFMKIISLIKNVLPARPDD